MNKKLVLLIFGGVIALAAWTAAVAHLAYWTGVEDTATPDPDEKYIPGYWLGPREQSETGEV